MYTCIYVHAYTYICHRVTDVCPSGERACRASTSGTRTHVSAQQHTQVSICMSGPVIYNM